MAVLVVGGAGYIGSHAVKLLKEQGADVVVFDNLEKGHRESIADVELIEGDLRNRQQVKRALERYRIEAVMHFAAYCLVGESMEVPWKYYENNLIGTLNLLEAMRAFGVEYFIFSSTAAVYGEPLTTPIDEDHQTRPTNVYGETKLATEKMIGWFDKVYGIKSIALRYFNAAGADSEGKIGELHDPETHLIPLVLQTALGQVPSITIFGDDYDTRDGTCIRDYIHVTDLARAHILALDFLKARRESQVFNLGNEKGFSVLEIVEIARDITGKDIPVQSGPRRPGDPAVLIASSDKAKTMLGWKPELYDIRNIISTAWKWHSGRAKEWKTINER